MANFYRDNADIRFYFDKGIDWDALVRFTEHDFKTPGGYTTTEEAVEAYASVAELVGEFAAEQIAPFAAQVDREGVLFENGEARFPEKLQSINDQMKELGLHSMCIPRELGGMNSPMMLYFLTSEFIARGDVSIMTHHGFHGGIALAMLLFSVREGTTKVNPETGEILETRFRDYIEEIARGDAWGCMDITEPDAGSDMARLRATGEQDENGDWFITGTKIFITSGHGKYHFVIARTEKAENEDDPFAGLGGLSMFLVPAYTDHADGTRTRHIEIGRVEEKLGHHASVTAELHFERVPAHLVGKRGEGFAYMLTLMNNARVGVGFECIGLCEAAIDVAAKYAQERKSMGKTIDRHEMIADYLDEMRTDVRGARALAVQSAYHEELTHKIGLHIDFGVSGEGDRALLERERDDHKRKARRLTPLLKYFAAEKAVEMSRRAMQILGGVGYTKEFPAEKLLRDALVMPVYEGTSQIQALMVMKDTLGGIIKNPQGFLRRGAQARWRSVSARDALERQVGRLQVLAFKAEQHLILRTAGDKFRHVQSEPFKDWPAQFLKDWNPKRDFSYAMLHAERLTRLLVDEAIAELFLEQAERHPERREVLEKHLERALPRARFLLDEITSTGDRLLATLATDSND